MLTEDPSTTTRLPREDPPLLFKVEYTWKEGGKSFDHLDFCNTIVENVAAVTPSAWNKDLAIIQFSPTYNIRMGFVSDRSGPGLHLKHVVWALVELFNIMVKQNRFSVGNIVVNSNWDTDRLAVGTVTVPGTGLGLVNATDELSIGQSEDSIMNTSIIDPNNASSSPGLRLVNSTQSKMQTIELPTFNRSSDFVSANPNTEDRIQLHITWFPGGATFHDVQIYSASLQLLVQIAQVDDQDGTIWPVISTYNDMDDFTLSVGPIGFAKHSELTWGDTAIVLAYMGLAMSSQGTPGRMWAELEGIIENDKIVVGIFCVAKGNRTGWRPAAMCPKTSLDSIPNDNKTATA